MQIRRPCKPSPRRWLACLPPLLAAAGVLASGWQDSARGDLAVAILALRLAWILRTLMQEQAALLVDLAAVGVVRCSSLGRSRLSPFGEASRVGAAGTVLVLAARLAPLSHVACQAGLMPGRDLRRLARWLRHGRRPAACWRPQARALRGPVGRDIRQIRPRFRYNCALRAEPTAPCPPS